jgi:hypothetical protein
MYASDRQKMTHKKQFIEQTNVLRWKERRRNRAIGTELSEASLPEAHHHHKRHNTADHDISRHLWVFYVFAFQNGDFRSMVSQVLHRVSASKTAP